MELSDKRAVAVLMDMLERYKFNEEEKEAVKSAIGILSWTSLAKTRLLARKAKMDKKSFADSRYKKL